MKTIQRYFLLCLLAMIGLLTDCGKGSDPAPAVVAGTSSSSINGTPTNFTTSKATDTGAGLEIVLADNSKKITMNLGDKTANTYTVKNTSSGRLAATTDVTITVVIDNVIYYGVSGSVVTTVGTDGKLSGTFDIVLKSSTGQTLTISGGKINSIDIGAVPAGCRISSITYSATTQSSCDGEPTLTFIYNGDGRISRITDPTGESAYYFYDVAGKLAAITTVSTTSETYRIEFTYNGTTLTSFKERSTSGSNNVSISNYVLSYNGTTVTGIADTYTYNNTSPEVNTYTLGYNTGNVTSYNDSYSSQGTGGSSSSYAWKNYDTKKNPFQLLAQLSGTPISLFYGGVNNKFKFTCLSTNNPTGFQDFSSGRNDVITYVYNAQNYPSNITYAYGSPYQACVQSFAIVYSGCQ